MSSKPLVIGNWKMNLSVPASVELVKTIRDGLAEFGDWMGNVYTGVAPSYFAVSEVAKVLAGSGVNVGTQNICGADVGAFTGEISANMLKEVGASFAIIGHSDRRNTFGESNDIIGSRVDGAVRNGIVPILCVGENLLDRKAGKTKEILSAQLSACFQNRPAEHSKKVIVAYEPVWAISTAGTGLVATLEIIEETHQFILDECKRLGAPELRGVLYGGSVAPDNFAATLALPSVHGALVGGASLKANQFLELIRIACG